MAPRRRDDEEGQSHKRPIDGGEKAWEITINILLTELTGVPFQRKLAPMRKYIESCNLLGQVRLEQVNALGPTETVTGFSPWEFRGQRSSSCCAVNFLLLLPSRGGLLRRERSWIPFMMSHSLPLLYRIASVISSLLHKTQHQPPPIHVTFVLRFPH